MGLSTIGKLLIICGLGIVLLGGLFWALSKTCIPFGKLPGDIKTQGERISFYFPIVTSIVLSIFLTLLINFIFWLLKK